MEKIFLNKEALLAKPKLTIEKVEISEGYVFVREMTGHEKDIWEQSMLKAAPNGNPQAAPKVNYDLANFRAKLAVSTICDEEGNLLFTMSEVHLLNKALRASDLEKIVDTAQKLNAVTDKDKEEILKNLEADRDDSSNSSSADN